MRPIHQRPSGRPLIRMQWRNLLFMHWPIASCEIRSLIPSSLEIDEFEGTAWIGLIPFTMRDVMLDAVPRLPGVGDIPAISAFHECNVRTYVHPRGRPDLSGVWFFSLDAASRPAVSVARRWFHLRYFHAKMSLIREGNSIQYAVNRREKPHATMQCEWRVGDHLPHLQPGELAYFLTERYMLFTENRAGHLHRSRIWHDRWPLRAAELLSLNDELVHAAGIPIDQTRSPILHHADELNTHAWRLEPVTQ